MSTPGVDESPQRPHSPLRPNSISTQLHVGDVNPVREESARSPSRPSELTPFVHVASWRPSG